MALVRDLIKRWLLRKDIILSRPPGQFVITEIKLRKMRDRGLKIQCAVDGGAAEGGWAREFKGIYPEAQVLCVEPRDAEQARLAELARELKGVHIGKTLLGASTGPVEFFESGTQSSTLKAANGQPFGKKVTAEMTTLDDLITKMKLPWPDLIKLDLQGAELAALVGAGECLKRAQAVMLEVSFIALQLGMPLIGDVIPFMSERGFMCYDIAGLWHRPLDGALAQGDFVFLKKGHALLADGRWSAEGAFS